MNRFFYPKPFVLGGPRLILFLLGISGGELHASQCTVSSSGTAFGVYSSTSSSPLDTTGIVTVSCIGTGNVSYVITLSAGGSGNIGLRKMSNSTPTYKMDYNLFIDSARTIPWGDGTSGSATLSDAYRIPGSGAEVRNYAVYGRVPAGQPNLAGGPYLDTITVTVTYRRDGP